MAIFISVAAYRDPELSATIGDCINKADHPDLLTFGICWQREVGERFPWLDDSRFHIIDTDWRNSRGVCWARAEIQKLWHGEDYYFQIDSHCRFAEHWDSRFIDLATNVAADKPIISTYCPPYRLDAENAFSRRPLQIEFYDFTSDGLPLTRPIPIPETYFGKHLIRGRFLAAGFLFTLGSFANEVAYDPNLYFFGEEISLAVRSYTWGYEIFHPTEVLGWHHYVRRDLPKHWHDHAERLGERANLGTHDEISRKSVRKLLTEPEIGKFKCGPMRSVKEYETYAGIDFVHEKVQDYTRFGKEPPNPSREENWQDHVNSWTIKINLEAGNTTRSLFDRAERCYIRLCASDGARLHETAIEEEVIRHIRINFQSATTIQMPFNSETCPHTWTIYFWNANEGVYGNVRGKFDPLLPSDQKSLGILTGYVIPS